MFDNIGCMVDVIDVPFRSIARLKDEHSFVFQGRFWQRLLHGQHSFISKSSTAIMTLSRMTWSYAVESPTKAYEREQHRAPVTFRGDLLAPLFLLSVTVAEFVQKY